MAWPNISFCIYLPRWWYCMRQVPLFGYLSTSVWAKSTKLKPGGALERGEGKKPLRFGGDLGDFPLKLWDRALDWPRWRTRSRFSLSNPTLKCPGLPEQHEKASVWRCCFINDTQNYLFFDIKYACKCWCLSASLRLQQCPFSLPRYITTITNPAYEYLTWLHNILQEISDAVEGRPRWWLALAN